MPSYRRWIFQTDRLLRALDAKRERQHLSWRKVSEQAGVTTVNLGAHLAAGRTVTADTLARLLLWLGDTDLAPYLEGGSNIHVPTTNPDQ